MYHRVSFWTDLHQKFDDGDFWANLSRISVSGANLTEILATLRIDQSTFYCCRWHVFAVKTWVVQYDILYCWQLRVAEQYNATYCCVFTATVVTRTRHSVAFCVRCICRLLETVTRKHWCCDQTTFCCKSCFEIIIWEQMVKLWRIVTHQSRLMSQFFRKLLPSWASLSGNIYHNGPVFRKSLPSWACFFRKHLPQWAGFPETFAVVSQFSGTPAVMSQFFFGKLPKLAGFPETLRPWAFF